MAKVVFKYGTRAEYDALTSKDSSSLYFLTDTGEIYRGDVGLAQGSHYEIENTEKKSFEELTAGLTPLVKDDTLVVKTPIAGGKTSYTAYVYDGKKWCAMDGNYDAENVYFDRDMTFTKEVGYVTLKNGSASVASSGKNIKEVMELLFSKEEDPEVTAPSVSVSLSQAGSYEVGTKVAPSYTTAFTKGAYSYGPDTGITATAWKVTNNTTAETLTTATGSFQELQVEDNTNFVITAEATYGEGAAPVSNLGNEKAALKIKAGTTKNTSAKITGYRNMFIGSSSATVIDSAAIRALSTAQKVGAATINMTGADGADCMIVAIPQNASVTLNQVLMTSSMNADVTATFVKSTPVAVKGKNDHSAINYNVWIYKPAKYGADQAFKIIIK